MCRHRGAPDEGRNHLVVAPPPGNGTLSSVTDTPLGAILAGGASKRMGRDKATVEIDGRPMVLHVAAALRRVTPHVVAVGRNVTLAGLATVPDTTPGRRGPVAGLEAALIHAAGASVLLVATDQPFVRAETLARLVEQPAGDAVVPESEGILQPTCALYRQGCLDAASEVLARGGGSLQDVLAAVQVNVVDEAQWRSWGEDGRSWLSIDTPEALAAAGGGPGSIGKA